ncbi:putative methyltransferase [Rhodovulum sp. PH10]|nr:putative methyltransferase [Rhodovulum sp. PH10]
MECPDVTARSTRILMIYPRFTAQSFWNYAETCKLVEARYPAIPLGMITVAAMLPAGWDIRLIDRNVEDVSDDALAEAIRDADLVMTGGMMFQQPDTLRIVDLVQANGRPVVVGGPDPTSSPHIYARADFQVLGEAEEVIADFVAAWKRGERAGVFEAEKFKADVTRTPAPRYDLLRLEHYLFVGVQFSRGCPFTCEFCDIIELYGRTPRTKTAPQVLAELDRLYALGYRGHVDFVDDNFIGNKKVIKTFLPHLIAWQEQHGFPFEFSTEASINLGDDKELLALMQRANFFAVFVGIESPDPETLKATKKKQNTRRDIASSVHAIYAHGMFVTAGFIVGFDSEKASIADAMVALVEDAAIPLAMIGLLAALPNTQLTRRLAREERLHPGHDVMQEGKIDITTQGLNFDTLRPRDEIVQDYVTVLRRVYDPAAFAKRLDRLVDLLDRSGQRRELPPDDRRAKYASFEMIHKIISARPEAREVFWRTFTRCAERNPLALRYVVMLMGMYLHVGPFARQLIADFDRRHPALEPRRRVAGAH